MAAPRHGRPGSNPAVGGADGSLWEATLPADLRRARPSLDGDAAADVAVVGAGFTGLWTAYYLARRDPSLRIVVVEREHVGFGASGRNGGWCSALMPMSLTALAERHGRPAAIRFQQLMNDTVDEVARVVAAHGIDCDLALAGTIDLVRSEPQRQRALARLEELRSFGFGDDLHEWMSPDAAAAMCGASKVRGALYSRQCATVHPAKLVHGLAQVVESLGVRICERTTVERIEPRRLETPRGRVSADVIVRATEGYTAGLPGSRRDLVPLYSMMIATEPLDEAVWDEIGLGTRPTFADGRYTVIYGQRTGDGRLAFGGRGAPYHFGSRIRPRYDTDPRVRELLRTTLTELFPVLQRTEITHHWGGPLGVPRDWHSSARYDRSAGLATAGGYVGDGVAFANLAGRTLADLVTGADSELVRTAWVGHRSRRWEPEPLRWLGVNAVRHAAWRADRYEERHDRAARRWSLLMSAVLQG